MMLSLANSPKWVAAASLYATAASFFVANEPMYQFFPFRRMPRQVHDSHVSIRSPTRQTAPARAGAAARSTFAFSTRLAPSVRR